MAILLLGSAVAHAGGNADGFTTPTFDSSAADFILVSCAQSLVTSETLIDSKGCTWHPLTARSNGNKQVRQYYTYDIGALSGPGHTLTIAGTDTFPALQWAWYSGVKTTADPFGAESGNTQGFGTTVAPGSLTPTEDGCLLVASIEYGASDTPSINAGMTVRQVDNNTTFGHMQGALADLIQGAAAACNPTWTMPSSSTTICAAMAWFKPGPAPANPQYTRSRRGHRPHQFLPGGTR